LKDISKTETFTESIKQELYYKKQTWLRNIEMKEAEHLYVKKNKTKHKD
jgi:hypothetical protein